MKFRTNPPFCVQPSQPCLIVNADDLGLAEAVDQGIYEAHEQGIVTSASLFVNFDHLSQTCASLRSHPRLDTGLHLNLTWGPSLTKAPSLTRQGQFLGKVKPLAWRVLRRQVREAEVLAEVEAQMQRFRECGFESTHINTHQHVMLLPPVARAIWTLAPRYGFRWVRAPWEAYTEKRWARLLLNLYVGKLYRHSRREPSHSVFGVLYAGELNVPRLLQLIPHLTPGVHELICHPARDTTESPLEYGRLHEQRGVELEALSAPEVKASLNAHDVRLVSFREAEALGQNLPSRRA